MLKWKSLKSAGETDTVLYEILGYLPNVSESAQVVVLIFVMLLFSFGSYAQIDHHGLEKRYQAFLQVLDQENARVRSYVATGNVETKTLTEIPEWFTNLAIVESRDTIWSIGISDPGMPDSAAFLQALERAKLLALIQLTPSIKYQAINFASAYELERNHDFSGRFGHHFQIWPLLDLSLSACTMRHQNQLTSGETILLLGLRQEGLSTRQKQKDVPIISYYQSERQSGEQFDTERRIQVMMPSKDANTIDTFTIYAAGSGLEVRSQSGTAKRILTPSYTYIMDEVAGRLPDAEFVSKPLDWGLWTAFLAAFAEGILTNLEMQDITIRSTNDKTAQVSKYLTSLTTDDFASFRLHAMVIKDNELYLRVKRHSLDQNSR